MGDVDVAFMGGILKVEFRGGEDGIDMILPEAAALGVALQGTTDRDNEGSIEGDVETFLVPFGKDVVDGEESGYMGTRGMGVGVAGIAGIDQVVQGGGKGTEEPEYGGLDARGVRLGEFVEDGSSTRGTIATMSRSSFATCFDLVLPVWAQDDGVGRAGARFAEHAECMELVTLFLFGLVPERPGREGF